MVDDDATSVEPLRAELAQMADATVTVVNFQDFHKGIEETAPNIIVLDLAQGNPAEMNAPGVQTFEDIWNKRFCPLVVYTAVPELLDQDTRLSHPFIRLEPKG